MSQKIQIKFFEHGLFEDTEAATACMLGECLKHTYRHFNYLVVVDPKLAGHF